MYTDTISFTITVFELGKILNTKSNLNIYKVKDRTEID